MKNIVLKINGMTCAACANAVERATKKLEGITESNVNFDAKKLNITYDETKLTVDDIKKAVSIAGYEALEEVADKKVFIPVQGMTCPACANRVGRR